MKERALNKAKEILGYYQQYNNKIKNMEKNAIDSTVRREYSKGGNTLHRGYYCPSPIQNLIIGNVDRGKLITSTNKPKKFSFEYFFDKQDRLVYVKHYENGKCYEHELLIYLPDKILSIEYEIFDDEIELSAISACIYKNNILKEYTFALCCQLDNVPTCTEITSEEYAYNNGILSECLIELYYFSTNKNKAIKISREKYKYNFKSDYCGRIASYTVEEYDNNDKKKESDFDGHIFKIN